MVRIRDVNQHLLKHAGKKATKESGRKSIETKIAKGEIDVGSKTSGFEKRSSKPAATQIAHGGLFKVFRNMRSGNRAHSLVYSLWLAN